MREIRRLELMEYLDAYEDDNAEQEFLIAVHMWEEEAQMWFRKAAGNGHTEALMVIAMTS